MMAHFKSLGHEVYAAADEEEGKWADVFAELGVAYRQISVSRNGVNPFTDLQTLRSISNLLSEIKPDKIFVYQAKTISYGCIAAKRLGITEIYPMVGGLGSIMRGSGLKSKVVKAIMCALYKNAFKYSKRVFLQNNDDRANLVDLKLLEDDKVVMINGSGVNLDKFKPLPIPETISFLFVGRVIRDKGAIEYLEACKKIKQKYPEARCVLVGPFDTNPSSLQMAELQPYIDANVIEYAGMQSDVAPYLAQCSVFVLPSYHEGTPKSTLEAMASARPVITTDAPGCRETVKESFNGFLVPVGDVDSIVEKMEYFINNPDAVRAMGANSLQLAREKFDVRKVNTIISSTMCL